MAKYTDDTKTAVIVEKGNTLWGIADAFLDNGHLYKQLATINNISNPNLIYVGQIIHIKL